MIVLAIDTTHEFGSIALKDDKGWADEVLLHEPEGFSAALFDQISGLLHRNGLGLSEVGLYAAAAGPGSFTGVRIGLTAVKAMAEALAKPGIAVSNLRAMLRAGSAPCRAVILDARRGEVYGGVCGAGIESEVVAPFPIWLAGLPDEVEEFVAFDFTPFASALGSSRFAHARQTRAPRGIASAIADIALEQFRNGDSGDPALLDANYVRRSDAELLWKDRL